MIRAIAWRELTEWCRDGRILGIAGMLGMLAVLASITGWLTWAEHDQQVTLAQAKDDAAFIRQGAKSSHSAAHFGRLAHKPSAPFAVFDPGVVPYLGQVIWLEAHRRDPAMFRAAEDSTELRRLADLSVAGVLTLLLPLLIFIVGHGVYAAERDRGTLRQVLSIGPTLQALFWGKFAALAASSVVVSSSVVALCIGVAFAARGSADLDTLLRGCGLLAAYALYGIGCVAVTLLVSARARSAAAALLILLMTWAVGMVLVPRLAATAADKLFPVATSVSFWNTTAADIRARRPPRDSLRYRELQRVVASEMLGRELSMDELASAELNRQALALETSERLEADAYAEAYEQLNDTYAAQARVRRIMAALSPAIVLQHASSALAGTDLSAHQQFAAQAERHRALISRRINEDMMLRGAGQGFDYLPEPQLWASIPPFRFTSPTASSALRSAAWDLAVLALWSLLAATLAWRASTSSSGCGALA